MEVAAGAILFHPRASLEGIRRFGKGLARHGLLNYRTATSRLQLLPGSSLYDGYRRREAIPAEAPGPYAPPLLDPRAEWLHEALLRALAPLRPCWLQAVSQLPGLVSHRRADGRMAARLGHVRAALKALDALVGRAFTTLVDVVSRDAVDGDCVSETRQACLDAAMVTAGRLHLQGLVPDRLQLEEAILSGAVG